MMILGMDGDVDFLGVPINLVGQMVKSSLWPSALYHCLTLTLRTSHLLLGGALPAMITILKGPPYPNLTEIVAMVS
jgi:hypothetical protein